MFKFVYLLYQHCCDIIWLVLVSRRNCFYHFLSWVLFETASEISRGGGGTSILTVAGTCRWTGYDFLVITIDTGYLNRPTWLLAGYSVYHRVASQPGSQPTMSGPRSRHQRRCVRDATYFYECTFTFTQQNRESVRIPSTNEPWINSRSRNSLPLSLPLTGYAYECF